MLFQKVKNAGSICFQKKKLLLSSYPHKGHSKPDLLSFVKHKRISWVECLNFCFCIEVDGDLYRFIQFTEAFRSHLQSCGMRELMAFAVYNANFMS